MTAGRVAITGASSFLGSRLLRRLAEARGHDAVVAIDVTPPEVARVRHHELDLTLPAAGQRLLELLREEQAATLVHAAFFTNPRRDAAYAHELESIGTLGVLAAAAAAGVGHVVMRSFTAIYGADGRNPAYLTEDRPPRPNLALAWARDKLEAEQHAASFARRYPAMKIAVLRFAPLLGPGVRNFYTRVFDNRLVPVPMGYDPLVQLLHPEDAMAALTLAVETGAAGVFNVVPARPLPLLAALHLAGKVAVPVPHPVALAAAELLWAAGLAHAPGGFVDYVRFPVLGDGEKARRELGFAPRHSSRQALEAYMADRYPRASSRTAEADGDAEADA